MQVSILKDHDPQRRKDDRDISTELASSRPETRTQAPSKRYTQAYFHDRARETINPLRITCIKRTSQQKHNSSTAGAHIQRKLQVGSLGYIGLL